MCYSAKGKRLLTGSLDKRVKVIDTKTYRVLHTMSYPSPILSIGVSVSFQFIFILQQYKHIYTRSL